MKKILSIILPSLIIVSFMLLNRDGKGILLGIYLLFPITFIVQGLLHYNPKKDLALGFILSSLAFIIPINLFFKMGSCIELLLVYIILGFISFKIKERLFNKHSHSV